MTYRELFNALSEKQKDQTVTVWNTLQQEFYPAGITIVNDSDVLDPDHIVIVALE